MDGRGSAPLHTLAHDLLMHVGTNMPKHQHRHIFKKTHQVSQEEVEFSRILVPYYHFQAFMNDKHFKHIQVLNLSLCLDKRQCFDFEHGNFEDSKLCVILTL